MTMTLCIALGKSCRLVDFVFGVSGWVWGQPQFTSITFFLDGSAMVCDQHGRPIKGTVRDGKEVWFATTPPMGMMATNGVMPPYERRYREVMEGGRLVKKTLLASHAEVIAALAAERCDWQKLERAGTPQLPYEQLVKLPPMQHASAEEMRRIPDPVLRKAAMRVRREAAAEREAEMVATEDE